MKVYRICNEKYADDLSGYGAFLYGGRWNPKGTYALYTSMHRSLAMLELLVHRNARNLLLDHYVFLELELPDEQIVDASAESQNLVKGGDFYAGQQLSSYYFQRKNTLAIAVSSVIIPQERNIIINPQHKDFQGVKVLEKYAVELDRRLAK